MKIPFAKKTAEALRALYDDSARVLRSGYSEEGLLTLREVYSAQRCHLSAQRATKALTAFRQTEAEGRSALRYTVYFPPGCDILPGDLIEVEHCGRLHTGRAGEPVYGKLGVRTPLDSSSPL